jgi:hypothetical protein
MKVLIKKIIITLLLKDKTHKQVRDFARKSSTLASRNSEELPDMKFTTGEMTGLCDTGDEIARERALLKIRLRTLTVMEKDNRISILNELGRWVGIVQGMPGLTRALVIKMGWKTKSVGTKNRDELINSSPVVSKINQNTSKTIHLDLLNSKTRKKDKPYGAKGWMPFTQIGGKKPIDRSKMKGGIPRGKMNYSKTFSVKDIGKQFHICFVWYDGKDIIGLESPVYTFTII